MRRQQPIFEFRVECRALVVLAVLVAVTWSAQAQPIRFARYSLEQGLSQVTVNSIVQDHRGFLWLGTEDGLNRFDGYEFTVYRRNPSDPSSLPNNAVWTVAECIKRTNGTDRGAIQEALSSLEFETPIDTKVTFKNPPHGNNLTPSVTVLQVTDRNKSRTITG